MPERRRPRRAVTGRAIVLGAVVVLVLVLLASPLNRYFGSRSDLHDATAKLQRDQQTLQQLTEQHRRWSDPGFVQQQARQRLQYAMPGDTVYVVVGEGAQSRLERARRSPAATSTPGSWNTRLWDSVEQAAR